MNSSVYPYKANVITYNLTTYAFHRETIHLKLFQYKSYKLNQAGIGESCQNISLSSADSKWIYDNTNITRTSIQTHLQ